MFNISGHLHIQQPTFFGSLRLEEVKVKVHSLFYEEYNLLTAYHQVPPPLQLCMHASRLCSVPLMATLPLAHCMCHLAMPSLPTCRVTAPCHPMCHLLCPCCCMHCIVSPCTLPPHVPCYCQVTVLHCSIFGSKFLCRPIGHPETFES